MNKYAEFTLIAALLAAALTLSGCHGHDTPGHADHAEPSAEAAFALTRWTDRTELFMEYKPLVAGREASFAAHLTELGGFKPVRSGKFTLTFTGLAGAAGRRAPGTDSGQSRPVPAGKSYACSAEGPSSPGIFRPAISIPEPGRYRLRAELVSGTLRDRYDGGEVEVFAAAAAAAAAVLWWPRPNAAVSRRGSPPPASSGRRPECSPGSRLRRPAQCCRGAPPSRAPSSPPERRWP
ncbi:MAG: RND family efflux transporter MFP subunit [Elusimicrobia bacterium]|nr:MAG: RND family efflux transporter MFP subunit [Elusimicrobiota bacterium]